MPINKKGILKNAIRKPAINPSIETKTPKNAAGELINPTAKDVSDFNAKYTTTFPGRAMTPNRKPLLMPSRPLKLVPGPSGTAEDLIKRTEASAAKSMKGYMDYKKPGGEFKNLAPKPAMPSRLTPPSVKPMSPKMNTLKKAVNGAS